MITEKKIWPNSRRARRVFELHAPKLPPFATDTIPAGGILVDLGMGNGSFLFDARTARRDLKLIGVSASPHEIIHPTCDYADIKIIRGKLPYDPAVLELLNKYQGRVDYVFDTYGPATYSHNPLHSLIFSAILLKEKGAFSAITGTEGTVENTVFGSTATQDKITKFFKDELKIEIEFLAKEIESEVQPGKKMTDFIARFTKGNKVLKAEDYYKLCKKADQAIGFVKKIIKTDKQGLFVFGQFKIQMKEYEAFKKCSVPANLKESEEIKSRSRSWSI